MAAPRTHLLLGVLFTLSLVRAESFREAKKAFGVAMAMQDREEKAYWKEFKKAQRLAQERYEKEWLDNWGLPTGKKDVHYDFSGYRELGDRYFAIVEARCAAIEGVAGHGAEGMELLYKTYEHYLGLLQRTEKQLVKARPKQAYNYFDQRPGLELHGHDRLMRAALRAMVRTDGEAASLFLLEQYPKALKADQRTQDVLLRDAILQTLARNDAPRAVPLLTEALQDPNVALRVVAVEALGACPEDSSTRDLMLTQLRGEEAFPVAMAILSTWTSRRWSDPRAIPVLIELFRQETDGHAGILRWHYAEALRGLTGEDQGLNPLNWEGWMAKHEAAIQDGTYTRPEPEPGPEETGETETREGAKDEEKEDPIGDQATVSFFDIKTLSKSVVFLVDASDTLMLPADIEVARRKSYWEWRTGSKRSMEGITTQLDRLIQECEKTLESLHPDCLFNVVLMMEDYRKMRFQPQLVPATPQHRREALKFLKAARPSGWASQLSGIRDAMEMGGMPCPGRMFDEARCDTVFLLSDGVPCGGWWMDARETVRAFQRYNRFRNMTVHSIRIADEPREDAEYLMQGLAQSSGGSYVWLQK